MVKITERGGRVYVESPFHPEFISQARNLRGKWISPAWVFDGRDTSRIKQACMDIYGECGEDVSRVDVRIDLKECDYNNPFYALGRLICERKGRDYSVKLGEGVVILEGGFPDSGGSVKHPLLKAYDGTIMEVRDVPLMLAQKYAKMDGYTIVSDKIVVMDERLKAIDTIKSLMEQYQISLEDLT